MISREELETRLQALRGLAERERAKGARWVLVTPGFLIRLCAALGINETTSQGEPSKPYHGGRTASA
jgi:hypothetical protein